MRRYKAVFLYMQAQSQLIPHYFLGATRLVTTKAPVHRGGVVWVEGCCSGWGTQVVVLVGNTGCWWGNTTQVGGCEIDR